jgi:hypothetical protein
MLPYRFIPPVTIFLPLKDSLNEIHSMAMGLKAAARALVLKRGSRRPKKVQELKMHLLQSNKHI